MLQFIIGAAGTGKTTLLRQKIHSAVKEGARVVLLVPEQFSFESERALHRELGQRDSLGVEVYSFTRLCRAIFCRFGGLAGAPVTAAARYVILSLAVSEMQDRLRAYRKSARNTTFLTTLLSACSEFKSAGILPDDLARFSRECESETLRDKLADLSGIYQAYQSMLQNGYSDPEDSIARACALLEANDFFAGAHVFVDGFFTFLAGEFEMLSHIIAQAGQITFALPADSAEDTEQGIGIYSPVREAMRRLTRAAKRTGTPTAPPVTLTAPHRYAAPELGFLSQSYPAASPPVYQHPAGNIRLSSCTNTYAEVERAAAEIAALVRDQGYRYREIGVICRDPEPYLRAFDLLFGRYGIPFFADRARDVENTPLMAAALCALDAVGANYERAAVLLLAKNPLLNLDPIDVAMLENYCYSWEVRGAVWLGEWRNNPRGMTERFTDEDTRTLEYINRVRERVIGPLARLRTAVQAGTGQSLAHGVYDFLQEIGAPENMRLWAGRLPQGERETALDENAQLWDLLMEILDLFGSVLGQSKLPPARLCELFRLAVASSELVVPPQTLDQVLVGAADRIRPEKLRAVFVLGANEGVFPPAPGPKGVFSDQERGTLIDAGLEVAAPGYRAEVLERFYCYFALTLPGERLYVSAARNDLQGRELFESPMLTRLRSIFPKTAAWPEDKLWQIAGERSALSALAARYAEDTVLTAALIAYFEGQGGRETLDKLERAREKPVHAIESKPLARRLFGDNMRLSPTGVERYYRCAFAYFARDGLRLDKRKKAEFNPLESGSVLHYVMQVMVQRHQGKGLAKLPEAQMSREISEIIREYLALRVPDVDELPARMQYLFANLCTTLTRLLRHLGEEFAQSRFVPVAFELAINARQGVPPLALRTADGGLATVEGVLDRVDLLEKNGQRYVRVVDYKSGRKDFKLQDVLSGLNMQMLLYLFTLQEHGTGELADAEPAGVLYMPLHESYTAAERDAESDKAKNGAQKQRVMSGLVLNDIEVIRAMEADIAGVYIPVKMGKNGLDAKSSLATRADMGRLARKVKEQVSAMASALAQGKIAAWPLDSADYPACEYCDYRAVCGYEPEDPVREIAKLDRAAFFALLEREELEQNGD